MPRQKRAKKTVAVIGYGSQGRAIALNLRDSGYSVVVGLRGRSKLRRTARNDGIDHITTIGRAVSDADIVCFAFPDHAHGRVFNKQIKPNLQTGCTLWFLAGMSVHFRLLTSPENCDVILIAPHAPGITVRRKYLKKEAFSTFCAIYQNPSGRAQKTVV
ncbi:MAG: NAD(P)-binding domain-containing protein, partial [Candidatus Zixiibacteriota bacterium]